MSDPRDALVALLRQPGHAHRPCTWQLHEMPPEDIADAILAAGWTPPTVKPSVADVARAWHEALPETGPGSWARVSERVRERALNRAYAVLDLFPGRTEAEVKAESLAPIRAALAAHPRCDAHPDDGPITCGWKAAVADVQSALEEVGRD